MVNSFQHPVTSHASFSQLDIAEALAENIEGIELKAEGIPLVGEGHFAGTLGVCSEFRDFRDLADSAVPRGIMKVGHIGDDNVGAGDSDSSPVGILSMGSVLGVLWIGQSKGNTVGKWFPPARAIDAS